MRAIPAAELTKVISVPFGGKLTELATTIPAIRDPAETAADNNPRALASTFSTSLATTGNIAREEKTKNSIATLINNKILTLVIFIP